MLKNFLTPQDGNVRRHQRLLSWVALGVGALIIFASVFFLFGKQEQGQRQETVEKVEKKQLTAPMDVVNEQEIWAARLEKRAEGAEKQVHVLETDNKIISKRVDLLEKIIQGGMSSAKEGRRQMEGQSPSPESQSINQAAPSSQDSLQHLLQSQKLPAQPSDEGDSEPRAVLQTPRKEQMREQPSTGSKILHLELLGTSRDPLHTAENYIPSGTYAKAVLTSGVVASTSTQSQGNPQPIVLRLADEGNLPRGWKSTVKDAVLIGACYGDLSSERVLCRLESMSWVESDGETVERKVEGWIIGEDGRPGLRGKVVDRAGDVARESFIAGILSGMANFLQFESTRSVYPVSPFGQTNSLSNKDALQGGLGKGASNALDKLAEFSIKRAESMSPVLVVNSGRVVDVVFRKGVDLFGAQADYKVIGSDQTPTPQQTLPKD